jgi:hypothetical protein
MKDTRKYRIDADYVCEFIKKRGSDVLEYVEKKRCEYEILGPETEKHTGIIVGAGEVEALYFLLHAQKVRGYIDYLTMFPDLPSALLHHNELILPVSELIACDISHVKELEGRYLLHVEFDDPRVYTLNPQSEEYKEFSTTWSRLSGLAREADVKALFLVQHADHAEKFFRKHAFYTGKEKLVELSIMSHNKFLEWWKTLSPTLIFEAVESDGNRVGINPEVWKEVVNPIITDLCFSFMMKMPRMFFSEESPYVDLFLSKLTERTEEPLRHVVEELQRVRSDVYSTLIDKRLLGPLSVDVEVPLSIGLVLRELPDNAKPSDFSDALLKLRNDRCVKKFREWIERYQGAIITVDVEEIAKTEKEVQIAAANLRSEFLTSIKSIEIKRLSSTPAILLDLADQKYASAGAKIAKEILEHVPFLRDRINNKHLIYMQRLVKSGIRVANLEKELVRCFGSEGRPIALNLKHHLELSQKIDKLKQIGISSNR